MNESTSLGHYRYERGVCILKQNKQAKEPTLAEGMNTEDELDKNATFEEISSGEYTKVVTLSLDENDPN